jgi:hypothetical protein
MPSDRTHLLLWHDDRRVTHLWHDDEPLALWFGGTLFIEQEGQPYPPQASRSYEPCPPDRLTWFSGAVPFTGAQLTPAEVSAWRKTYRPPREGDPPFSHMMRLINLDLKEIQIWLHCQPGNFTINGRLFESDPDHPNTFREKPKGTVPVHGEPCALERLRYVSEEYLFYQQMGRAS